jgi:hypothetical protein
MLDDSTLAILRALAGGIDPSTGHALPADHVCQQPATVRALCAALGAIESTSASARPRRTVAGALKAGLPWDATEDTALAEAFARGATFEVLAQEHQRTRAAIEARLVRLGKIEAPPGLRLRESAAAARQR